MLISDHITYVLDMVQQVKSAEGINWVRMLLHV